MTSWLPRPEIGPPSSMLALLQIFVLMGGLSLDTFSLTVAPVDLSPEWTEIELREPLTARTGNPRLIVYVRDVAQLGIERKRLVEELPRVLPRDSLRAVVTNGEGRTYDLHHTGYSFFRGAAGIVLEEDGVPKGETFYRLKVRASQPLEDVTMVWLDSLGASRPN